MRGSLNILPNAATALSALIALATAALWVRGYRTFDTLGIRFDLAGGGKLNVRVDSERGRLAFVVVRSAPNTPEPEPAAGWYWRSMPDLLGMWSDYRSGFGTRSGRLGTSRSIRAVIVPHWFAALAFAALPGYRLARRVRRRHKPGHCPKCGYDLRATPDRCPECGAIVSQ